MTPIRKLAALAAVLLVALAACSVPGAAPSAAAKPQVTILAPASGSQVPVNQAVTIQVNGSGVQDVTRIEIKVDGVLVATAQSQGAQGQPSLDAVQPWIFGQAGSHVVSGQAYNAAGQVSDPAVVTVLVMAESASLAPTAVPTSAPVEEVAPENPAQQVQFCDLFTVAEAEAILGEPAGPPQVLPGGCGYNNASNSLYVVSVGAAQGAETESMLQGLAMVLGMAGLSLDEAGMQTLQSLAVAQDYRGFFEEMVAAGEGTAVRSQLLAGPGDVAYWAWVEAGERRQGALVVVSGPTLVNVNLVVAAGREEPAMLAAASALTEAILGRLPGRFTLAAASVQQPPSVLAAPVVTSFAADPATITAGGSATLRWEVTGADAVEIDQGIGTVEGSGSRQVSPAAATTYQLTARNAGGQVTATVDVTVNAAPPAVPVVTSFAADPATITAGGSATLRWEVTGATSVEIDQGIGTVDLSGSRQVSPAATTTYQLTVRNSSGATSAKVTVTVKAAPPPAVPAVTSFTADPAIINAGGSATLHWEVTGATSVEIDQGIGKVDLSGSRQVSPAATTTYKLTVGNSSGATSASVTVTVKPAPPPAVPAVKSFTADPATINAGGSATLHWEVTGATNVEIDQGIGKVDLSGSRQVSPAATTTYKLTVGNSSGATSASVTVTVNPLPPPAGLSWGSWAKLGGIFTFAPAVASWTEGRLDVFVRGTNTHLMHRTWRNNAWGDWEDLGGELADAPACVSWGSKRIDCFVRGKNDSELWHRAFSGGDWQAWEKLGGVFTNAPTVASWSENRLDVFVRGTNTHLMHRWWNGSAWSGWEDLGGELADAPACVSWATNRIDCFVRGKNDSELWHKAWTGSQWSGWEKLGGAFTFAPAVASWAEGRLDVFVRGTNTHLMHRWWNGSAWSGWEDLGGELADAPACVSRAAERIDCLVRGQNDSELWHRAFGPQ